MKNKCSKCTHYRPVEIKYLDITYKHKCAVGKFHITDEDFEKNIESSLQKNGDVLYSDNNYENFWKGRWICLRKESFFIEKVFPNILAIIAIIISVFAYYKPDNKTHKFTDNNTQQTSDTTFIKKSLKTSKKYQAQQVTTNIQHLADSAKNEDDSSK